MFHFLTALFKQDSLLVKQSLINSEAEVSIASGNINNAYLIKNMWTILGCQTCLLLMCKCPIEAWNYTNHVSGCRWQVISIVHRLVQATYRHVIKLCPQNLSNNGKNTFGKTVASCNICYTKLKENKSYTISKEPKHNGWMKTRVSKVISTMNLKTFHLRKICYCKDPFFSFLVISKQTPNLQA